MKRVALLCLALAACASRAAPPRADDTVSARPAMPRSAESSSVTVYWALAASTRAVGPAIARRLPITLTATVLVMPPATAVTVMVRLVGSAGVLSVAVAAPLALVFACVTARPPELVVNTTGTPATKRLLASCTTAVMVAGLELSDGMVGVLVDSVRLPTVIGGCAATTGTATVPLTPPAVAVTVMVRSVASPAVTSVAAAVPSAAVLAVGGEMPPELEANVTGTLSSRRFDESRTNAVMVADSLPSLRIETLLLVTVTVATAGVTAPAGVP